MPYKYELTPEAATEYEQAYKWYNMNSNLAAAKLVIAFAEAVKQICRSPYQFRNPYKEYRELSLRKFPYKLIYIIDEKVKKVIIITMFHHKRDPRKKFSR